MRVEKKKNNYSIKKNKKIKISPFSRTIPMAKILVFHFKKNSFIFINIKRFGMSKILKIKNK